MQSELSFLVDLQNHDLAIGELKQKADDVAAVIAVKNKSIDTLKANLKAAKDALSTHTVKKKQLEGDADAKEKLLQKHQSELNSLKSNDAYKAMLSEIQAVKDGIKAIEDEILNVMEAVDNDDKKYKELEKKFKTDEGAVKSEIQNLESQKNAFLSDVQKRQADRDAFAKTVPPALLSQYDVIREQRGGVAIVPMVNNSCGGCHMTMTPAKCNEVRKAKAMVLCDSCTRILYLPPQDAAATPAVPAPSSVTTA